MARNQMRNQETYKIRTGQVNEFEYQKHSGELTEQFEHHSDEATQDARPMTQAERVKSIMAAAHEKVEKRRKKESAKNVKSKPKKGKSESKRLSAASKDAAKMTLRKSTAKKSSKKR